MAALKSYRRLPSLEIPRSLWEQMRADVAARSPEEACGLVGGQHFRALEIFPMVNALHSPARYRLDPQEQIGAFLLLEQRGWELLAIYHSHPRGPAIPSPTDLAEAAYPESIYLIWNCQQGNWDCRGFVIETSQYWEVEIQILDCE